MMGYQIYLPDAVLHPVFLGRYAVFFFEGPEKAGIVFESELLVYMADGQIGENRLSAGMKTLFQDILMERDSHIILKNMGNMVLAHIKKGSQMIQA